MTLFIFISTLLLTHFSSCSQVSIEKFYTQNTTQLSQAAQTLQCILNNQTPGYVLVVNKPIDEFDHDEEGNLIGYKEHPHYLCVQPFTPALRQYCLAPLTQEELHMLQSNTVYNPSICAQLNQTFIPQKKYTTVYSWRPKLNTQPRTTPMIARNPSEITDAEWQTAIKNVRKMR